GAAFQTATAQTVPYDSTKKAIIYTEVVQMPGMDKGILFDRAMTVLNSVYNEAAKKMDTKDREGGTIMLKCTTRVMLMDPKTKMLVADKEFIKYKLYINFKDGKYKYEFTDFHIDKGGFKYPLEKFVIKDHTVNKETRADEKLAFLDKDIKAIIAKLKEGIKSEKTTTKEDW
ncbi:MAG: DUF4468 domain-containing protein, partial [Bacteroidia bacterium]